MLPTVLVLLAAAADLTLHPPPPPPSPQQGAPAPRGPDATAIFRVGHEQRSPPPREFKLEQRADGSYVYDDGIRFSARIAPDGSVAFHDKPTLQLRKPEVLGLPITGWLGGHFQERLRAAQRGEAPDPLTHRSPYHADPAGDRDRDCVKGRFGCWMPPVLGAGAGYDATDAVMRAAGQDPYRYEKVRFLDATADLRIRLAVEQRRKLLKETLESLSARLDELWDDARWSAAERRRIIMLLLEETDRSDASGARAAQIIQQFLRSHPVTADEPIDPRVP